LDAEILEFEFDLARHRFQRGLGIAALLLARRIEQGERRQQSGHGRFEQRNLALALDALADLDLVHDRFDARFAALAGLLLFLLHHRLAFLTRDRAGLALAARLPGFARGFQ